VGCAFVIRSVWIGNVKSCVHKIILFDLICDMYYILCHLMNTTKETFKDLKPKRVGVITCIIINTCIILYIQSSRYKFAKLNIVFYSHNHNHDY